MERIATVDGPISCDVCGTEVPRAARLLGITVALGIAVNICGACLRQGARCAAMDPVEPPWRKR